MKDTAVRSVHRWFPVVEYSVGGNWSLALVNVALLFVGWYFITEYWWQPWLGFWHWSFEYVFLMGVPVFVVWHAFSLQGKLDGQRSKTPRLSLPHAEELPAAEWKYLFGRAGDCPNGRLNGFYNWMAEEIPGTGSYTLEKLATSWHRPKTWTRTLCVLAWGAFLASPLQFVIGHSLALSLDRIFALLGQLHHDAGRAEATSHILRGKVCYETQPEIWSCTDLKSETWPGACLELKGDAPDKGYFLLVVQNWPRSGRRLKFTSESLMIFRSNVPLLVRGKQIRINYMTPGPDTWHLSAEINYYSWTGDLLHCASYWGNWTPVNVRPNATTTGSKPTDGGTYQ